MWVKALQYNNDTEMSGSPEEHNAPISTTTEVMEKLVNGTDSLTSSTTTSPQRHQSHLQFPEFDDMSNFSKQAKHPGNLTMNITESTTADYEGFKLSEHHLILFISIMIAVLGVLFNSLGIIVFTKGRRSSRRDIRVLIINLCVADLLYSLTGPIPHALYSAGYMDFPNNDYLCKFWRFFFITTVDMSPMANLAIAIERTMVVFSPARTLRLWNRKRTMYMIIAAFWTLTVGIDIEYLYRPIVKDGICRSNTAFQNNYGDIFPYYIMSKFFIPTMVIVILYAVIGAKLLCCQPVGVNNMDKDQRRSIRARNKLVRMLFIVALVSFLAWTPSNIDMLLSLLWPGYYQVENTRLRDWLSMALFMLQLTNGFTTPIIYFFFDEHFKKDLDEIMCCTRSKKNAKRRRRRRARQSNSRSRIADEISAAEPSTTSTVIDSGV